MFLLHLQPVCGGGNIPGSVILAVDKPSPNVDEMVGPEVQMLVGMGGFPVGSDAIPKRETPYD